jgi:predicted amidohydrolase YtcJ
MDPERPSATAVAVEDGTIVAVGDDATVRAECDTKTEIVDGAGMHIVPGLTDSHFHPFWGSEATRGVDLTKAKTLGDLQDALAAERQRIGPDDWVVGWGATFELFQQTGIRGEPTSGSSMATRPSRVQPRSPSPMSPAASGSKTSPRSW